MSVESDLAAAWKAYRAGNAPEAESLCRQILEASPVQPQALHLAGLAARRAGRLADAQALLEQAAAAAPRNADLRVELGAISESAGSLEQARKWYYQALELRLGHAEAQARLRRLQARIGAPERAVPVSVIIATIGAPTLRQAVESVLAQSHRVIELLVVADGPDAASAVRDALGGLIARPGLQLLQLPWNTGAGGLGGHRIYAAASYLVNGRYVAYLDEDNWFEPDHLALLSDLCTSRGLEWAYALRRIVDADGQPVCHDDCESLGRWPTWHMPEYHHVDTNCYFLRRDIAQRLGPVWYRRLGDGTPAPVAVCGQLLRRHPHCDTSGAYTVNYRVARTAYSVKADFFLRGNEAMRRRYPNGFPWLRAAVGAPALPAPEAGA